MYSTIMQPENYKRMNDYSTDFSLRKRTQENFSHSCLNYDYGLQRTKSEKLKLVERISQSDLYDLIMVRYKDYYVYA